MSYSNFSSSSAWASRLTSPLCSPHKKSVAFFFLTPRLLFDRIVLEGKLSVYEFLRDLQSDTICLNLVLYQPTLKPTHVNTNELAFTHGFVGLLSYIFVNKEELNRRSFVIY